MPRWAKWSISRGRHWAFAAATMPNSTDRVVRLSGGLPLYSVDRCVGGGVSEIDGNESAGQRRAHLLPHILADEFGSVGDRETSDDPDNADLIGVIDRRRSLPVSLSILYVAVARRLGWTADALDVLGHVLTLIGDDIRPTIIDPFRGGLVVTC